MATGTCAVTKSRSIAFAFAIWFSSSDIEAIEGLKVASKATFSFLSVRARLRASSNMASLGFNTGTLDSFAQASIATPKAEHVKRMASAPADKV